MCCYFGDPRLPAAVGMVMATASDRQMKLIALIHHRTVSSKTRTVHCWFLCAAVK